MGPRVPWSFQGLGKYRAGPVHSNPSLIVKHKAVFRIYNILSPVLNLNDVI